MSFSFLCRARWRLHRYILGRRKTIKRLNIHLGPKKSVKQKRPFLLLSKYTYGQENKKNKLQLLLSSTTNSETMKTFDCFQQYLLLCSNLILKGLRKHLFLSSSYNNWDFAYVMISFAISNKLPLPIDVINQLFL